MNEKIKEILDYLKNDDYSPVFADEGCDDTPYKLFDENEVKILLNYIINLQEENKELNRVIELYSKSLYNADLTRYKEENQKLNKIIDELEKFCNEEIKEWYKADFGEEIIDNNFKQTLTTYEFILKKLNELKKEVE